VKEPPTCNVKVTGALQFGAGDALLWTAMPTILIVDDSPVVLQLLRTKLHAAGAIVIEASSTSDACAIDPDGIDAALLDLDLGDGTGVHVAETLLAQRADLPVAFFSSETEGPLFMQATSIAEVFSKENADDAVAWAVSRV
jgi:CheY-like chemotaxis protein